MTDREMVIAAAEKVMGWTAQPLCSNPGSMGYFPNALVYGPRKRAGIVVKRQRYKCLECEKTFFQPLPGGTV
jgi:hypothetical protein